MEPQQQTDKQRARSRTDCRACPVVCEWVIYPVYCLRNGCPYIYAFEEDGTTFFGCVQGVFAAELDLAPYRRHPRRDVYGAFRATRTPLARCHQRLERVYEFRYKHRSCVNPVFAQHPRDYSPEAVRRLVEGKHERKNKDADPPRSSSGSPSSAWE